MPTVSGFRWRGRAFLTTALAMASAAVVLPTRGVYAQTTRPVEVALADGQQTTAEPTRDQLATVERLKSEAFKALRGGNFDQSDKLLRTAATLSGDQSLAQMSQWLTQYQSQRADFVAERRKQYDKAVADVHKLLNGGKEGFAVDRARDAYVLAEDKTKFAAEPWVKSLTESTVALANKYEQQEQWLKILRLYSDLNSVEPTNQQYKDKLKAATRRVRLLAMYTPDDFKALAEVEAKEREEADALLKEPTTQPTTVPATRPAFAENESFKVDWHDTLKGVQINMLYDSLENARTNYWKDLNYRTLLIGGLKAVESVATTKGLEKAFPNLADQPKREKFIAEVERHLSEANDMRRDNDDPFTVKKMIATVRLVNRQTVQIPDEVLINEFADGAFGELDPFSNMIWPSDLDEFNKSTQGEFGGVGIQIQNDEDLNLKVVSPLEDTPAYRAGVKAGDVITKINGKSATGISTTLAVKYITGVPGTEVTLTIRSAADGNERDVTLRREIINVASVKGWKRMPGGAWDYFVDPNQKIGYLRLTNFTKKSYEELKAAVREVQEQGGRGLVLDLRRNPGGLLTAATEISDEFLTEGTIVSTRADRENPAQPPTSVEAHPSAEDCNLPMVVLVNQFSASASEIVSGALKDQHRAIIVGERTFGKGSVQMLFSLANRTAYLKLTTSHYYLPSGRCIHKEENSTTWGVEPDVRVEVTPQQMDDVDRLRAEQEVLRGVGDPLPPPSTKPSSTRRSTGGDLLSVDSQLAAAVLVMRLQLAGATWESTAAAAAAPRQ